MRTRWWPRLGLLAILAAACALRFWGLGWGLPNSLHAYSYHPDEFLLLGAAGSVLISFLPRFYNYPSLYIYLVAFAVTLSSAYGLAHGLADSYLCARVVTALMGVAAVWAVYWSGRRLWGLAEGLLAALMLCIAPLHVQHSHFATVDVPSTLFVAACLGFAGLVLTRGSWRDYVLCGVMAGLAAGTKYNAGLVVLSLVAAHFLGSKDHDRPADPCAGRAGRAGRVRRLIAALACAVAAFAISTPGAVIQWHNFVYGLTYEMRHAATGHGLVFAGTGNGFVYTFTSSLWYGLGPALAILFIAAAIYGLVRLDRRALVILAFALPYYALISLSQVRFARYALPMFPAAALLIAWMAGDLWSRFPKGVRWAWAGLCAVLLAGTLLYTIALDRLFVLPDPRDRAARWIFANIPTAGHGAIIGIVEVPWFYSPPYSKTIGFGTLPQREDALLESHYAFEVFGKSHYLSPDANSMLRWIVLSDYETGDAVRLLTNRSLSHADHVVVSRLNQRLQWISQHYTVRKTFASDLSAFGVSFGSTEKLPHDMRYPAPTLRILEAGAEVRKGIDFYLRMAPR